MCPQLNKHVILASVQNAYLKLVKRFLLTWVVSWVLSQTNIILYSWQMNLNENVLLSDAIELKLFVVQF